MQDIINAFPDAAFQISNMVSALFSSGLGYIIVPFVFLELAFMVFKAFRAKND